MSGNLPSGLTLNSSGVLSGTATGTGSFPVTVRLTDASGQTTQVDLVINVNSSSFSVIQPNLPDGFTGIRYSGTLTATGGVAPIVYLLSTGSLPPGVVMNMNGTLRERRRPQGLTGSWCVLTGGGQAAQATATIRVQAAGLSSSRSALVSGRVGQAYTSTLTAFNGTPPYVFSVVSGSLPAGLTLASNGSISGFAPMAGQYFATFRVTDANGAAANTTIVMSVN